MKLRAKSAEAFMRNLEFCKKSRFYPIPMGCTIVTHMCIFGPVSWSVLGSNIVWIMGKTSFINEQNPFHEGNYKTTTTTTRKTFRIRLIHQMVWPVATPDFFSCGGAAGKGISKQWSKLEHHWLGQADAVFQICLLLLYKRITLASSVQKKSEQIMFEYP